MDRDSKYSIISVNADSDEEVVIQAGAVGLAQPEEVKSSKEGQPKRADSVVEAPRNEAAASASSRVVECLTEQPTKPQKSQKTASQSAIDRQDLDGVGPMSNTQKAIIICAILFIGGFILYYSFLR